MKNIHVVPTDKPSRLYYNIKGRITFSLCEVKKENTPLKPCYNIYITSDEIISNCWCLNTISGTVFFYNSTAPIALPATKKIILTTDQELINDGVQAIDDEFLEWFVSKANDSGKPIDIVEVERNFADEGIKGITYYGKYFIIIPKEEPKQETLEEAFKNTYLGDKISFNSDIGKAFELGYNLSKEQDKNKFSTLETAISLLKQTTEFEVLDSWKQKVRELEQLKNK